MPRIILACVLVGLLGVSLITIDGVAKANPMGGRDSVRLTAQPAVASANADYLPPMDSDESPLLSHSLWRSGFLLGALVIMTVVLLVTHYREKPDQTDPAEPTQSADN